VRVSKPRPASPVFGKVHELVKAIPRGRVATYGQLSGLIRGRLSAVGVGWALRNCGDAIPWHRVVNASGGLSTKGDAADLQRDLLEAEGLRFGSHGTIDLARYQWKRRVT
jgi:methylated-DNA-protein-cysteine methyltransferase-like protein